MTTPTHALHDESRGCAMPVMSCVSVDGNGASIRRPRIRRLIVLDNRLCRISMAMRYAERFAEWSPPPACGFYLSASFIDNSHRVGGFEAGADGFLTHPVDPAVLVATSRCLLRNRNDRVGTRAVARTGANRTYDARARGTARKTISLATLSHELRSPLTAIVGWTQVRSSRRPHIPKCWTRST
jgi:signal transduction histidine kinase